MTRKVEIDVDELKELYGLMEDIHDFFHFPHNFGCVEEFAVQHYEKIKKAYYHTLWGLLPEDVQKEIEER